MASDWATAKANEVLSAFSWASKVGDDPLRVIAQALREARAEGMEAAAEIVERGAEFLKPDEGAMTGFLKGVKEELAEQIRAAAHAGEIDAKEKA
jgi:hypothetical protein